MKGKTNNPNGRPRGVPNRVTADLREWIKNFIVGKLDQVERDFKRIGPMNRMIMIEKLMKYIIPSLQAITTEFDNLSEDQLDEIIQRLKASANESKHQKRKG